MRRNNCEAIRQELDELMLDETYSVTAAEHLRECAACREFYEKQTKLRQIVGSLGTVSAPADFDFRLRARLASESSNAASSWNLPFARRGFALAAMMLLFMVGAVMMWSVWNRPATNDQFATKNPPEVQTAPQPVTEQPVIAEKPAVDQKKSVNTEAGLMAAVPDKRPQIIRNERPSANGPKVKRSLAAQDFSSEGNDVIRATETAGAFEAFPLDASLQSFKVSLDDGRGNARTISVPTVSFGSQRMLQTANQFAPKRAW